MKRSFRYGEVQRSDLKEAFPEKPNSDPYLTSVIKAALSRFDDRLQKEGQKVRPIPGTAPPSFINDEDLIDSLERGGSFAETGFRESELPLSFVKTTNSLPNKPGLLTVITRYIAHQETLQIIYTGIKMGAIPQKRHLYPLGLERKSDQWRLVAIDLDEKEQPTKVFLLSRILDAGPSNKRKPRNRVIEAPSKAPRCYQVELNPKLNEHQRQVVKNQFAMQGDTIRLPQRYLFEFKIDHCSEPVPSEAVWPLLTIKKEIT
ncbi:MAG: WYL domain-containing protein [Pseudomonadales bacterium]|nr:WYL domain-containing protein [Pseudomonadales bacterium]